MAIVAIYGDDVIEQQLATDQMLLHFGNLAMHMNGELVLRKVSVRPHPHVRAPPTQAPPCPQSPAPLLTSRIWNLGPAPFRRAPAKAQWSAPVATVGTWLPGCSGPLPSGPDTGAPLTVWGEHMA